MDFSLYRIKYWLTKLSRIEPSFGYHSDLASILLVTSEANLYLATTFFSEKVFKIKTVLCYLDRWIVPDKDYQIYMEEKLASWIQSVYLFSNIYEKEPKDIFSGLICSLNNEREHIQHVLYHTLETVYPTNCDLYRYFKPAIFGVKQVKEYLLQITSPPNKNYRHRHLKNQSGGTNQSCQFMGQYSPCS